MSTTQSQPLAEDELARLTFLGAAGTVTGSMCLMETREARLLIECGMFQGGKSAAIKNAEPFPFDPQSLDAVLLTHAHIDHSGLVPKLTKAGYKGPYFCTHATEALCRILLKDAANIQESSAALKTRRNERRGKPPVQPLYRLSLIHISEPTRPY